MRLSKIQKSYVRLLELNGEIAINRHDDSLFVEFMKVVKKGGCKINRKTETHTYFGAW